MVIYEAVEIRRLKFKLLLVNKDLNLTVYLSNLNIYFIVPHHKNSKVDRHKISVSLCLPVSFYTEKRPFFSVSVSILDLFPLQAVKPK